MPLTRVEDIAELLASARNIAVVGCSDRPSRPSYGVSAFLQRHGYRILPVNPQITGERVHNEFVWRDLGLLGVPIDIVDIFRRPIAAGEARAVSHSVRKPITKRPIGKRPIGKRPIGKRGRNNMDAAEQKELVRARYGGIAAAASGAASGCCTS